MQEWLPFRNQDLGTLFTLIIPLSRCPSDAALAEEKERAMKRSLLPVMAVTCGLLLCTTLSGCGGGSNSGSNSGNDTSQVTNSATHATQKVMHVLLGTNTGGARGQLRDDVTTRVQTSGTFACTTGQVALNATVTGTQQNFAINGTLTFTHCDGIDGALTVDSSGTLTGSQIALTVTLNGTVSAEGCTLTFSAFSASTTGNTSGTITSPIIVSGVVRATCNGDNITCTLNSVDLADTQAFENSCHE
jgi:hypothetical protein